MKRLAYLWSLLDARDCHIAAGVLVAALVTAAWLGYVHGRLEARQMAEARCSERLRADEARWRARGLTVVRRALPCEGAR